MQTLIKKILLFLLVLGYVQNPEAKALAKSNRIDSSSIKDKAMLSPRKVSFEKIRAYRMDKDFNYKEETELLSPIDNLINKILNFLTFNLGGKKRMQISRWLVISIAVCILAFAFYRIWGLDKIGLFQGNNRYSENGSLSVTGSETIQNYEHQIIEALRTENFAEAIRFWYFKTLHHMDRTGKIHLKSWKSNQNYLYEMEGKPGFDTFKMLTYYFEYSFYGGFYVNQSQYSEIEKVFQSFNFEK